MSQSPDANVKKVAIIAGAVVLVALILMVVFKDKIASSRSGVVQQAPPSAAEAEQMERRGAGVAPGAADANARAIASEKR